MSVLKLELNAKSDNEKAIVNVVLGEPTSNGPLAAAAQAEAKALADSGELAGKQVLVFGRCPVPVGLVLGHSFAHVAKAVWAYAATDNKFVCCVNHDGSVAVGEERSPEDFGLTPAECGYRPRPAG